MKKNKVKAIILAAGRGSRLGHLTKNIPKCLVELNKKPLISYQIKSLKDAGIDKIAIVSGYQSSKLKKYSKTIFKNKYWEKTNMVYSLLCAKKWVDCPIIVSYSDIVYPKDFVEKLINSKMKNVMIIDKNWKKLWKLRFDHPLDDAETLKINDDNSLKEIGNKTKNYNDISGQYIGLFKISPTMFWQFNRMINEFSSCSVKIDFTTIFQKILEEGERIYVEKVEKKWFEIDNPKDLTIAEKYIDF